MSFINRNEGRPVAIRLFSGGVNCITGPAGRVPGPEQADERGPVTSGQDYIVIPSQSRLNHFASSGSTLEYAARLL